MIVSGSYSELELVISQCYFCQNSEAVETLLQLIGENVWAEADQLLVDRLQQELPLSESFLLKNSYWSELELEMLNPTLFRPC